MTAYPLDQIDPNPWQTRQASDPGHVTSLAEDIQANGLLQTPLGRPAKGGRIQLAFGHNRLAAFRMLAQENPADFGRLPLELRALTDEEMARYAWSENSARQDLNPIEEALAIQRRIEDFGYTQDQTARALGLSRPALANKLRLLKLPEEVQKHLGSGQISPRQADALLTLYGLPEDLRTQAENHWNRDSKPSAILEAALDGVSSDGIRSQVRQLIKSYSEELNHAPWPLDQVFERHAEMRAPACSGCDANLSMGNWKYCTAPKCFSERKLAHRRLYLHLASIASQIPPLESEVEEYRTTDFHHLEGSLAALRAARCENLRLKFEPRLSEGYKHCSLGKLGFPSAEIVCKKQRQFCSCLNGLEAMRKSGDGAKPVPIAAPIGGFQQADEGDQVYLGPHLTETTEAEDAAPQLAASEPPTPPSPPSAGELKEIAREANAERRAGLKLIGAARQVAEQIIAQGLAENQLGAWWLLLNRVTWRQDNQPESIESLRAELAHRITEKDLMPWEPKSLDQVLSSINGKLRKVGLPLVGLSPQGEPEIQGADPDPAATLLKKLERLESWLAVSAAQASLEAVQGNLANLEKLRNYFLPMTGLDDTRLVDIPTRFAAARLRLLQRQDELAQAAFPIL